MTRTHKKSSFGVFGTVGMFVTPCGTSYLCLAQMPSLFWWKRHTNTSDCSTVGSSTWYIHSWCHIVTACVLYRHHVCLRIDLPRPAPFTQRK